MTSIWERPRGLAAMGVVVLLVGLGILLGVRGHDGWRAAGSEPDSAAPSPGGGPANVADRALLSPPTRSPAVRTYLATIELAGGILVPDQPISVLGLEGQLLHTFQTDPAGRLALVLGQGDSEILLRADFLPSLRTQSLHLPPMPAEELEVELGTIVLAGSGVVIRARGAEVFAGASVTCGLRVLNPTGSFPEYVTAPLSVSEGAQAYFEIPPGLDVLAFASCGSFSDRSAPFTTTRTWQLVVKDFSDVCRVELELRDVPARAAEGRIVWLDRLGGNEPQEAGAFRFEEVRAGGKLMLLGRFDANQRTTAALQLDYGPPLPLDRPPGGAWLDCSTSLLAPVEPVIAIGLLDAHGELVMDRPFSLQVDDGGVVTPSGEGLHLLRRRDLDGAGLLRVALAGAGVFEAPGNSLLPLGEGVFGLAVPTEASSGSLRVMAEGAVHAELYMRVRAPSGELVAVARPDAAAGEVSWTVQSLLPGRYDLFWSWGEGELCQRAWARAVEVLAGRPTILYASPPVVADLPGSFVGWDAVPSELRPIGISMEGRYARVSRDGMFRLRVAIPFPEGSAGARVARRIPLLTHAVDLALSPDQRSLAAELRIQDFEVVRLDLPGACERPDVRGEIWTRNPGEDASCVSGLGSSVLPVGGDSSLSIPRRREERLVGAIWAWDAAAGGRQDLLGFFEVPCGTGSATIACDGRALELRNQSEAWTALALEWTSPSDLTVHCPIGRIEADQTITVWCPGAVSTLVLTAPSGHTRRLAIEDRGAVAW